jgi:two-component system response regulator YesN
MEALARFAEAAAEALSRAKEERTEHPLSEADRYIRESFRETITVKGLAERLFLNPAYFGQAYQARYGIGVLERVHDLRIAEALRLIREEPSRKLSDVAETVGYSHYNHFLKQFEKRIGRKPTDVAEAAALSVHPQFRGDPPVIRSL